MGAHLASLEPRPALVLCSPARRTRETLDRVAPHLDVDGGPEVRLESELYLAAPGALLACIRALDDAVPCVLLIGHNPGLHELACALAGTGAASARERMHGKFPTAALAVIAFETDHWSEVAPAGGRLVAFTRPKDLD
jgi:phosphohistidine phosphatase